MSAIDCLQEPAEFFGREGAAAERVSDLPVAVTLGPDHVMVGVRGCFNGVTGKLQGLQLSYGVFKGEDVTEERKMYPVGLLLDADSWDDNRALAPENSLSAAEREAFAPVWRSFVAGRGALTEAEAQSEIQKRRDPALKQLWEEEIETLFGEQDLNNDGFLD